MNPQFNLVLIVIIKKKLAIIYPKKSPADTTITTLLAKITP